MFRGTKSPQNPWKSNTLEWTAPIDKSIHGNWPGEIPTVHRWPYDYSKPGKKDDFVPQNVPRQMPGVRRCLVYRIGYFQCAGVLDQSTFPGT